MDTSYAHDVPAGCTHPTARVQAVSLLGPVTAAAGLIWAFLQPERLTLLHPRGQGFLVAGARGAAARDRGRHRLSPSSSQARCSPTWRRTMQPPAEMVHWAFAGGHPSRRALPPR